MSPIQILLFFGLLFGFSICRKCEYDLKSADLFVLRTPSVATVPRNKAVICRFNVNYDRLERVVVDANFHNVPSCINCCDQNNINLYQHDNKLTICPENVTQIATLLDHLIVEVIITNHSLINARVVIRLYNSRPTAEDGIYECFDREKVVPAAQHCNGDFDCKDHSDEANCEKYCTVDEAPCNLNGFECFSPAKQRCNGVIDCPLAEDEMNCSESCPELHCRNMNVCYNLTQLCDGINDCADKSDEEDCSRFNCNVAFNSNIHFMCRNNKCINRRYVNDGSDDCGDGSDETNVRHRTNYLSIVILVGCLKSAAFVYLICRRAAVRRHRHNRFAIPVDFSRDIENINIPPNPNLQRGGLDTYLQGGEGEGQSRDENIKPGNTEEIPSGQTEPGPNLNENKMENVEL